MEDVLLLGGLALLVVAAFLWAVVAGIAVLGLALVVVSLGLSEGEGN